MTWYFDPNGETVTLYDPSGNIVAEDIPFSGSWLDYPREDLRDEVAAHLTSDALLSAEQAVLWAFQWLSGDVEEGTPPEQL